MFYCNCLIIEYFIPISNYLYKSKLLKLKVKASLYDFAPLWYKAVWCNVVSRRFKLYVQLNAYRIIHHDYMHTVKVIYL